MGKRAIKVCGGVIARDAMPHPPTNPLYSWLRKQGYWLYQNASSSCDDFSAETNKPTHLFLDGGKCHVPVEHEDTFRCRYAEAILSNTRQFAVEVRTPQFRLFMDLDLKYIQNDQSKWPLILRVVTIIQMATVSFFANAENTTMIVCTSEEKMIPNTDVQAYKQGVHLIWPGITVDARQSLALREACITACYAASQGENWGMNCVDENDSPKMPKLLTKWTDIIDASVYRPSTGLRMIGSCKRDSDSVYMPACIVHREDCVPPPGIATACLGRVEAIDIEDYRITHIPNPLFGFYDWVRLTTIRFHSTCSDDSQTQPPHTELSECSEYAVLEKRYVSASTNTSFNALDREWLSFVAANIVPLLSMYAPFSIKRAFRVTKKNETKYILCTDSRRCMNLRKKFHNSNHVYFVCDMRGVHQRCFCTCDTKHGRVHGYCRNMEVTITQSYPKDVYTRLFGDAGQTVRMSNKRKQTSQMLDTITAVIER